MTTQQLNMLTQMITQNRPTTSKNDSNDTSFKDMLEDKKQDNNAVKEEPVKNDTAKNETVKNEAQTDKTETSDKEDIAAKQALLANLLFSQNITPVQNEMSQQNTNLSAEQIIQPIIQNQNLENMQTMGDIQNVDNTQNVQTKQAEIPVQTEIAEAFEVKTDVKIDVKTDVKAEQNTAEIIQSQTTEKTTKTAQNTGETTQDMMQNKTSETETDKPEVKQTEVQNTPLFQNVESTPIKVGEKAPVLDTQSPNMEQDLKDIIKYNLKADGDKIEIQLNPSNLGKITVELVQKDGSMSVLVTAENSKTLSLLAQHAGGIETMMQERLSQPVQVFIEQQQPEQQFNDSQKQNNRQNQNNQNNKPSKDEQQNFIDQLRLGLYNLG